MDILLWIVFGLVVGLVAKLIMPGHDPGGIILTPAGEKFAQEVPPVLAMLDRTSYDAVSAESVKSEETPGN